MNLREARAELAALAPPDERIGAIRLDLDGPVGHLRIDNPSARSAMSVSMMVELADAVLVHSLGDRPLPDEKGGPFRLLVPGGSGPCANVKGVVRIAVR